MGTSISFSLLSVILFSVLWSPALSDKCSLACKGSSSTPSFVNGNTYKYGVDGTVTVYLAGADKQETSVKIFGQVSVSALGNCVHSLKVNSLAISSPDGKKYPAPKGIDKVVKFSLQDGRLGPEICAEEDDHRPSLNIKRAIISLLQTEQKSATQVDVFGACPTEVSSSNEGNAVLLHRSRDLSRCAHREQTQSELITAVYNPTAEIKNTQILRSILNIEAKLNNGVPEKVSAVEEYLYRPFSVGENGARAQVNTKLTLSGTSAGDGADGACPVSRTVIFENPHGARADHSNAQDVLAAVKETSKTLGHGATPKSAGLFAQLVRIVRSANKEDLVKVFGQVKGNNLEKRVFLDALLRAGTGFSIDASINILKSKTLSPLEQNLVFLSLGNAKHVNSDAIKSASSLLDLPDLPKGVFLGVGALAGIYCRDHNCHSEKSDGVIALSKKFAAKLQNCKPKSKPEEDQVVAVLKGIRNIRHLEDTLIDKLVHCAMDNGVKARVKVNALEAFLADPCSAKIKKASLDILKNRNLDSEIRIKAYLAVIACPCGKSANEIKTLLDSEPIHQVGRFITSSLRHIRSSSNPDKELARKHYGLIGLPNKFKIDDRKFSFYRELSFNVDALGIGGNLDETIIYSQDSFLPRSASLNLTTEIFGHSVNVLEVGGRQGNLDRVIEHFVGPKGFLRTRKPQEIYDEIVSKLDESYHKVDGSVRSRRSIKSEVDNLDKQIKADAMPYNNELDLDIYVKLFGTDAVFLSLGDDKGFDFNNFLDQTLKYVKSGLDEMKRFQHDIRGHLLFLDAELAYPTSTGLPLKLDFVGAATGRLDISSSVDVRQILRDPGNAKVDIKIVPSTDVELSLVMLVDADCLSTGIKIVNNLHSSTGSHVIAKVIENGQGIDLQWGLPIDKQEILTASHDMVFFTAEKGKPEKQTAVKVESEKKEYSACFDQLAAVIGINFCGEISLPFTISGPKAQESVSKFLAKYPLVGSSKVKLVLEKNDLRGYHVKGVVRSDNNQGKYGIELLFDVEGSKNRRTQLTGDLINNSEEKTIKFNLDSPIKRVLGQLSLYTKSSEYAIVVGAKLDDDEYRLRAGLTIEGNENRSVMKPIVEYQIAGDKGKHNIKVDGQVIREKNGPATKYSLQGVKFIIPNSEDPVNVDGQFSRDPKSIEVDVKVKQGQQNILLSGSLKGYDAKIEFQNTLNPYVNFKLNGHFENGENINHNDVEIYYSGDLRDSQNCIIFNQLFKRHAKAADDFNIISKNKFEIRAVPFKARLDFEVDPKKLDIAVEGGYKDKKGVFNVDARTHIKKQNDYSVKVSIIIDKQTIEALIKRDIVSPDKSNLENYVDIKGSGKYELSGVVLHKLKPNDYNVGAIGHLKVTGSGKDEDIKFDVQAVDNSNLYSTHANINSKKGSIVDFLLKITRGANPNGQLKLILKNTIEANGKFQMTDSDGNGNGHIMVNFIKIQRVIKGETKFTVKDPVYNAEFNLFLNFDKDNDDKLRFNTDNKRTETIIDSKNMLVYGGKTTELNIYKEGIFELVGKLIGKIEIVLPNERCLTYRIEREVIEQNNVYNGHFDMAVADEVRRGGANSFIKIQNKLTDTNFDASKIDWGGLIELGLSDGKNLISTYLIKNIPKGDGKENDRFSGELKAEVSGSLIPKKLILETSGNYLLDFFKWDDHYKGKITYGDDISFEIVDTEVFSAPEKGDKKYLSDFTVTARLPFKQAHDLKWNSKVQWLHPQGKDCEINIVEGVHVNGELYKVESNGKYGAKDGSTKLKVVVPHVEPIIVDLDYKAHVNGEKKTGSVDVKAQYGKGKESNVKIEGIYSPQDYQLKFVSNSPHQENLKSLSLTYHAKVPTPESFNIVIIIDADGRVYKSETSGIVSRSQPLFDIKYYSPSFPKPARIHFSGNDIRSNHVKLALELEHIKDFDLDLGIEVSVDKDVVINIQGNSERLGYKNGQMSIVSSDAGNGKRLQFNADVNGKNVISGSTSYISKQEGPKTIIEGSGTLKIKDEQKPANFKYIRTFLTEGNEQGIETFVNVAVGDCNHVAESRITNLEYKASYVYCEEKKQCAHAEVNSKILTNKPGVIQQVYNVGLDLRKLGFPTEFGLQSTSEYSDKRLPQYELNLHVNRENDKIHLHAYSQPEFGKFPAGITIALPQRVLAAESLVQFPVDKGIPFPIKAEFSLYPDKNKPQTKTAARLNIDFNTQGSEQGEASAIFGFSHPKLGKEALLKFRGALKRPSENTLKFETSAVASHSTLGNDREAKFSLEASPVHIKLKIDTPIVKVIDLDGKVTLKDNLQQGDLKFSLLQGKPVQVYAVAKDYRYFELSTGYTDESDRKLSIIAHLEPEKRVDISADIVAPGQKKNIIHGALFVQDNLIKSDYGLSRDNYQYFVNALKKDLSTLASRIREIGDKANAEFKRVLKRVEPTFKQIREAYAEDVEKLVQEISNDTTLKEISESLHTLAKILARIIDDTTNILKPIAEKIIDAIQDTVKKIDEIYEKQLEPQIKELYNNFAELIGHYFDVVIDVVAHFSALIIDFFEKHKPELEELTNIFTEIFKDISRILVAQLRELRAKFSQIFADITQQIKELPVINMIKEKWQELGVPQQLLGLMDEYKQTVRDVLPTEESKAFLDALFAYAKKKLNQEKVDETAELRIIYEKLVSAVTSLVQFAKSQLGQNGVPAYPTLNLASLLGSGSLSAPTLGGSASFNLLTQALKGDFPDPLALFNAYRPRSLNPLDEIPNKMRAVVINGQHIFTFDGRHLTFPGSCRYTLVHDHVDRNFTLVIQLANGNPKSLILEDKSGTTIELKENGQVALNGASHGYPVEEKDVFAFRQANGRIGMGSLYGLMVFCTTKLEVCYIEVSGFYLGKLRGLLGDGNNEPYDDFRMPNGKITNSESDFGNSYRMSGSCPAAKTPEHSHHQHHMPLPPACEKVFGGFSPLKPLSLFLDIAPFRQACIHAVSGDGEEAIHQACDLARGYAALALTGLLPAILPKECVSCNDADKTRQLGETYEIKLPAKQADIVVLIDLTKGNEWNYKEIVVPVVSQVIDLLKAKHITDVKLYLVGITSKFPYPVIYDTDLRLKSPKVKFDDDSQVDLIQPITVKNERIDQVTTVALDMINAFRTSLGLYNAAVSFGSLPELPLRATAVKHVLISVGEPCEEELWIWRKIKDAHFKTWMANNGVTFSVISDTPTMSMSGGKAVNNVVGYSRNSVLMAGDKKLKDTESLRAQLNVPDRHYGCVNFAEENGGVVFSASHFRENAAAQKQFQQTIAASIVNRLLHESLVQECLCQYVDPFRVRSICVTKERDVARRRK